MIKTANPDIQRWNEKYNSSPRDGDVYVHPVGEAELVDNSHLLDGEGLALEIACGKGENALYLASLGFQVVACDGALSGLKICKRSAQRLGLPVYSMVCDLEAMILPPNSFSFISVVRYLQRSLFDRIESALVPGGMVFYKTFNSNWLDQKPGFNPDYVVNSGELNQEFSQLEILASDYCTRGVDAANTGTTSYILGRKPLC